jgi:nucleotidyltransferase substrate binding protein (TIGR01987 family)
MQENKLDLTSFEKAVKSFKEVLQEFNKDKTNTFIRDSVVQRFEYTYELSYKMMRRYIMIIAANKTEIQEMGFQNIIRTASEKGLLLGDLRRWCEYREKRNITSHTYDSQKADMVVSIVAGFLKEAEFLLAQLSKKIKNL